MASSTKTPYEILGVPEDIHHVKLRQVYRKIILEHKQNRISAEDYRWMVRAYETLSDFDKRKRYDASQEWTSNLSFRRYTPQQLAAEPDLISILEDRVRDSNLSEINARDPITFQTTLYCAARAGNLAAVKFLTEQGAEPDVPQRNKSTALHAASFFGHDDVVRCLLERGADYRKKNEGNSTAEDESSTDEVQDVFTEMKESLYVRAAADEIDWFRNNSFEQHIDAEYYSQRQTLLHCASKKGYLDLVRLLVEEFSAALDIVDINGNSALHLAAYGGHAGIVNYLLTQGCDSTLINRWGLTAEQEGSKHGAKTTDNFQRIRSQDMFEMARNGVEWWFQYYFGKTSSDAIDANGTSLLYHACRHDQYVVAKWLLEHGANANIQLGKTPRSTPLHGAKYHGYFKIVELLLEYGADVTIKNDYKANALEEVFADQVHENTMNKVNELLSRYRNNLKSQKVIDVYIYLDNDVGDNPKTKVQLRHAAVYEELEEALPNSLKNDLDYFSVARHPLKFDNSETCVLSAVCRARYGNSKFIETPLRLTLHQRSSGGRMMPQPNRLDPRFDFRTFTKEFQTQGKITHFRMTPSRDKQTIRVNDLTLTFSESSIKDDLKVEVRTLFSPDPETFDLPGCVCLFEVNLYEDASTLLELPLVSIASGSQARLYTLATPTPYWFSSVTRRTRLPMLDGVHAFLQHVSVIPLLLTLPADMVLAGALGQPLITRKRPVKCTCLVLQEHDAVRFPEKGYHGTSIAVIQSIVIDGLVLPGTVVGTGKRISPPKNHIARGSKAFGVDDFAHGIFLSSSVHYSADPTYAIPFPHDDRQLIPVLECSVQKNGYRSFPSTVRTYIEQPGDDLDAIEWRATDPEKVVINAVLFIPTVDSIQAVARERMDKLN